MNELKAKGRPCRGLIYRLAGSALMALACTGQVLAAGGKGGSSKPTFSSADYDLYRTTTSCSGAPTAPNPDSNMLVLMGGGVEVDAAFTRMFDYARRASGKACLKVVALRATGTDGYNPYWAGFSGVGTVETYVVKTSGGANSNAVASAVSTADAVFIAGGDQWDYVRLWNGTALENAIKQVYASKRPIGGTSAGLAVLGAVDYTAQTGSVTSAQALANPYDSLVTLGEDFLEDLPGTTAMIFDSHFVARDRMGRLVAFLARMTRDVGPKGVAARAVGINEQTAMVISNGTAQVWGNCSLPKSKLKDCNAYFLSAQTAPNSDQLKLGTPLTFHTVRVDKLPHTGGTFSLTTWTSSLASSSYHVDAVAGVLTSSQVGGSAY